MSDFTTLPNGIEAVHAGGLYRALAKLAPDSTKRAALPRFADHFPLVPRAQWRPVSRRDLFTWVLDQGEHGSCTDHAACYAHRKQRVLQGMTDVELSATFGYAHVNGGRDNGAQIHDLLAVMADKGRCLMSEFGEGQIYLRQIPQQAFATARRFKILIGKWYTISTFDEAVSAILLNMIPVYPVMVGRNYNNLDSDNVCGHDAGPGNHAVHADGLYVRRNGAFVLDHLGSWGRSWGVQGRGGHDERHFDIEPDGYAFFCALDDPEGPHHPPPANESLGEPAA